MTETGDHPSNATLTLGAQRFVSLTTFRRDGDPVPTTVWVARDGDALIVLTPEGTGKLKRIACDPRVQVVPCSRSGRIRPGDHPVDGIAEIVAGPAETQRLANLIRRKYGLEYRLVFGIERLVARRQRPRVVLRITLTAA